MSNYFQKEQRIGISEPRGLTDVGTNHIQALQSINDG
jgi:hypothetical protein